MTLLTLHHIQLAMPRGGEAQARRFQRASGEEEAPRHKGFAPNQYLEQILIAKVFNIGGI